MSADESWELAAGVVRPYVLTRGRTRPETRALAVEAMVCATPAGRQRLPQLTPEQRRIVDLCRVAQSVAEVAAKLGTPLVVARVLIGDLVEAGLLEAFEGATDLVADVELLQRLIARVKAIPA